jgi:hypothetical protein
MRDAVKEGAGFAGMWYMDRAASRWWDRAAEKWVTEPLLAQTLRTQYDGETFESWCSVMPAPGVVHHLHYRVKFDDEEWAPYTCVGVESPDGKGGSEPNEVLKSGIRLGEPIAYLKQVWVDSRTQYRVCRNPDGSPQYVMMRRLSEDGSTNTGTCVGPDGIPFVSKVFTRHRPEVSVDVHDGSVA